MRKLLIAFFISLFINLIIFTGEINTKNKFKFTYGDNISDETTEATGKSKLDKALRIVNITHAVLGGIAYGGMTADCILGQILAVQVYNPDYSADTVTSASSSSSFNLLKIAHRITTGSTFLFMTSSLIMSYVTLGIKIYHKKPINIPHFISSIITSVLFLGEFVSLGITAWAFTVGNIYAKEIALAHCIYSYTLMASFTITLITLPIGLWNKKVLGNK